MRKQSKISIVVSISFTHNRKLYIWQNSEIEFARSTTDKYIRLLIMEDRHLDKKKDVIVGSLNKVISRIKDGLMTLV